MQHTHKITKYKQNEIHTQTGNTETQTEINTTSPWHGKPFN